MDDDTGTDAVDLYWLPLGAGDRVVRRVGRVYEAVAASRQHRDRCDLYHAALEVTSDGRRFVIESAPAWDRIAPDRGVVVEGPVGLRWLGRSAWFRYEVRCWLDGRIPDVRAAVDGPHRCSHDRGSAARVLAEVPNVPASTWGRDEQHTGEMWNSNSLISWLLTVSGHDLDAVRPPPHGRAPGWRAGAVVARGGALDRHTSHLEAS